MGVSVSESEGLSESQCVIPTYLGEAVIKPLALRGLVCLHGPEASAEGRVRGATLFVLIKHNTEVRQRYWA